MSGRTGSSKPHGGRRTDVVGDGVSPSSSSGGAKDAGVNAVEPRKPRVPLSIRLRVWWIQTADRIKSPDEYNRALVILTAVLGWITSSVAVQILITLVMVKILGWTGHKLEGTWFKDLGVLVAAVSGVISYLPLLLLPHLKETLWGPGSWWCRPTTKDDGRRADAHGDGKRFPAFVGSSGGSKDPKSRGSKSTGGSSVHGGGRRPVGWWSVLGWAALAAGVAFLLIQVFGWVAQLATDGKTSSNDASVGITEILVQWFHGGGSLGWAVCVILFITAFVTPVLEELLFRGVVTRSLLDSSFARDAEGRETRMRSSMVCLVGGVLFALTHLIGVGNTFEAWLTLACMTVLGWAFGLLDLRFRSVVPSIVSHVLYNCLVLGLMIFSAASM